MEAKELQAIVSQFRIQGTVTQIRPLGDGLINTTYKVETAEKGEPDYVLQCVNNAVFPDVDMLMDNIIAVTNHIRQKLLARGQEDIDRHCLRFIPTKADEKKYYYFDGKRYWRIMVFIGDSVTKSEVTPESSYTVGIAFGDFEAMLADIPVKLGETIKDFHNMEFRLEQLREAVRDDKAGRLAETKQFVDEIEKRAEKMTLGERLYREGKLAKRICHCDTKVNNMMFDAKTDEVLCVIDLDTVMPNFIFSDFGDFLRTAANTVEEDCPDIESVAFRPEIFKSFARGYIESAKSFLTPIEIENLPYATELFPYMQATRFFTDYLNGDTYYKIKYPEHNLVRTKNQLALLKSVEAHEEEMRSFIASLQA